ncbi:MAG: hypothetical protein ACREFB_13445, partial [Stellaceae bacterium]
MTALEISLRIAIPAMWIGWIGYWLVAARDVKRTRWREPPAADALHGVPLFLCMALLLAPRWLPAALSARPYPPGLAMPIAGTALV